MREHHRPRAIGAGVPLGYSARPLGTHRKKARRMAARLDDDGTIGGASMGGCGGRHSVTVCPKPPQSFGMS